MKKQLFILILAFGTTAGAYAQPADRGPGPGRGDRFGPPPEHREGREGREGRDKPGQGQPLTEEQVKEALATIRELHPDANEQWLKRIEKLAETNPEMAARQLGRFPRIHEIMETRKNRPEEFELHVQQTQTMRQLIELRKNYFKAVEDGDPKQIQAARAKVREQFATVFEIRMKMKRFEIDRMRKRLKDAEQELVSIETDRDKLIDQKLAEMLEKAKRPANPRGEGPGPGGRDRERERPQDRPRQRPGGDQRELN